MKEEALGFEINKAANRIVRYLNQVMNEAGVEEVTSVQGWILSYVYDRQSKSVYQRDIERDFALAKSTATNTLQQMEKKGYIVRISMEQDARLKAIQLTEYGRHMHEETIHIIDHFHKEMEVNISDEEKKVFHQIIHKIFVNIDRAEYVIRGGNNSD